MSMHGNGKICLYSPLENGFFLVTRNNKHNLFALLLFTLTSVKDVLVNSKGNILLAIYRNHDDYTEWKDCHRCIIK